MWTGVVVVALTVLGRILPPAEGKPAGGPMPVVSVDEADAPPALDLTAAPVPTPEPVPTPNPEPSPTPVAAPVPEGVPDEAQPVVVERIVDGDTIWVRVDEPGGQLPAGASHNIRLLEIDTPETQNQQECWGAEATAYIGDHLPLGTTVYLQSDQEDTDQYGRFLRYVWLGDGTLFNEQAVIDGHAEAALYEPNDLHIDRIREAAAIAESEERGMWGRPCDYDGTLAQRESPDEPAAPEAQPEPQPAPAQGADCHPSYGGACVPITSDVDCAGGSGNGPEYVGTVQVVGPDEYGLDRDGDGVGCEDA